MTKKAVDVVLLPAESMTEQAVSFNRELVKNLSAEIVLDKVNSLPHISLAMGVIDDSDVDAIKKILRDVSKRYPVRQLIVTGVHTAANRMGQSISLFVVAKTDELQLLHETIMESLRPYFKYEATAETVLADGEVAQTTLDWINSYREKSSFEHFFPHITLGYGLAEKLDSPIKFSVSAIALCHLGNHCTCRNVLVRLPAPTQ